MKLFLQKKLLTGFLVCVLAVGALTPNVSTAQTMTLAQQQQLLALYQQLLQLQMQLNALLQQQAAQSGHTTPTSIRPERNPFFVNVVTGPAVQIGRESITIQGQFDKGGSIELYVWVEYGSSNTLNRRSSSQTITRTGLQTLTFDLTGLISNTSYNYRVVAEDDDGNRLAGQVRRATTISRAAAMTFTGRPVAETEGVFNIRSTSASLQGFVSMNDFRTGAVFFVYGTDRRQVNDADRARTFNDIATARGVFDKRMVNRTFSGRNTVTSSISSLQRATTYHYRVCVEYDDGGSVIRCGQTESFTTQN